MTPGRVIVQIEKARNRLLSIDPSEKEKLLAASKKVDRLIIEYYRAKSCTESETISLGNDRVPVFKQDFVLREPQKVGSSILLPPTSEKKALRRSGGLLLYHNGFFKLLS